MWDGGVIKWTPPQSGWASCCQSKVKWNQKPRGSSPAPARAVACACSCLRLCSTAGLGSREPALIPGLVLSRGRVLPAALKPRALPTRAPGADTARPRGSRRAQLRCPALACVDPQPSTTGLQLTRRQRGDGCPRGHTQQAEKLGWRLAWASAAARAPDPALLRP